jgi:hypothetical protein
MVSRLMIGLDGLGQVETMTVWGFWRVADETDTACIVVFVIAWWACGPFSRRMRDDVLRTDPDRWYLG